MPDDVYEDDSDSQLLKKEAVDDIQSSVVAANTNILTSGVDLPTDRYTLRVQVALDPSATLTVTESNGGSYDLNAGSKLQSGALYQFDVSARSSRTYNFQASAGTTVTTLTVDRLPGNLG